MSKISSMTFRMPFNKFKLLSAPQKEEIKPSETVRKCGHLNSPIETFLMCPINPYSKNNIPKIEVYNRFEEFAKLNRIILLYKRPLYIILRRKMLYLYHDSIIANLKRVAKSDKYLRQIIIFGSVARDEHTPSSDLDILVVSDNPLESEKLFSKFRNDIYNETTVLTSFHYITPFQYSNSKDPFIKRIQREGKKIW